MKKLASILYLFVFTITTTAQTNYDKGMSKAFDLWSKNKTQEASQLFERISKAEKDNWLPSYYVASIEILTSFGVKDEVTLNSKLKKAQVFLNNAEKISPNNPEIIIHQALLNTAYINFDGQKYGMILSGKNIALYEKALKIAPNNPRVVFSKAEWEMGSARFFGKTTKPYCIQIEKAIKLFKDEKALPKHYPSRGIERAKKVLKECKS